MAVVDGRRAFLISFSLLAWATVVLPAFGSHEPPLLKLPRELTKSELTEFIVGRSFDRHTNRTDINSVETFAPTGQWIASGSMVSAHGTYRIEGSAFCVTSLSRDYCRRIYYDGSGYYIGPNPPEGPEHLVRIIQLPKGFSPS